MGVVFACAMSASTQKKKKGNVCKAYKALEPILTYQDDAYSMSGSSMDKVDLNYSLLRIYYIQYKPKLGIWVLVPKLT